MNLGQLSNILPPISLLLILSHAVDDYTTTAIRHRSNIFGIVRVVQAFGRRQNPLPIEVVRLGSVLGYRLIKHGISKRTRCVSEEAVQRGEMQQC